MGWKCAWLQGRGHVEAAEEGPGYLGDSAYLVPLPPVSMAGWLCGGACSFPQLHIVQVSSPFTSENIVSSCESATRVVPS